MFSPELLRRTIEVWQPHSKKPLTLTDAEEILINVRNFFDLLERWVREESLNSGTKQTPQPLSPSIRGPKKTCSLRKWYLQRGIPIPKRKILR